MYRKFWFLSRFKHVSKVLDLYLFLSPTRFRFRHVGIVYYCTSCSINLGWRKDLDLEYKPDETRKQ